MMPYYVDAVIAPIMGDNDRIHVIGHTILGAVFDDAAKHLTAPDGGPQLLESFLGHVRVARGAVRVAHQLTLAVFGHFHELVIDAQDVALLVGLRDNACHIHDVRADLELALQRRQAAVDFIAVEQALQQGILFGLRHHGSFKLSWVLTCTSGM